jgi:hypothetical protein
MLPWPSAIGRRCPMKNWRPNVAVACVAPTVVACASEELAGVNRATHNAGPRRHGRSVGATIAWLPVVLILAGCTKSTAPDRGVVRIEPTETTYTAGQTVSAVIRNVGSVDVAYATCGSVLEHREVLGWTSLGAPVTGCTDTARLLPVGATFTASLGPLPAGLEPGTYRFEVPDFRTAAGQPLPESERRSAPFLVVEAP